MRALMFGLGLLFVAAPGEARVKPPAQLVTEAGQAVPRSGKLKDGRAYRFVGKVLHVAGKPAASGRFTLGNGLTVRTDRRAVGVEPVILERPRRAVKGPRAFRTVSGTLIPRRGKLKDGRAYRYRGRVLLVEGKPAKAGQHTLANGITVKTDARGVHVDPVILDRPAPQRAR